MTRQITITGFIVVAITVACGVAVGRTWTDRNGRQVEAEFVSRQDAIITIKRSSDGKLFQIPLSQLSDDDVGFALYALPETTATDSGKPTGTWVSDRNGRQVEGIIDSRQGDKVKIKRSSDGKVFEVPLAQLSDADQARAMAILDERTAIDSARLQGTWVLVSREYAGKQVRKEETKLTIEGYKYLARTEKDRMAVIVEVFNLDATRTPKTIDFQNQLLTKSKGIYLLDGDTFTLARSHSLGKFMGNTDRPTEFATTENSKHLLEVWRREKK